MRLTFKNEIGEYYSKEPEWKLISRLGPVEDEGPYLIMKACDKMCKNRKTPTAGGCNGCPLRRLATLINGIGE